MLARCILCGSSPPPRLTREHIWPQWYSNLRPGVQFRLESVRGQDEPTCRDTGTLDLQPRVLCKDCNNRWGERLETKVRPRLTRMVDGEVELMTLPFCRLVAAWVTLKMMAGEYLAGTYRSEPFFSDVQRSYLRKKMKPPEPSRIWIGRYAGRHVRGGWLLDRRSTLILPPKSAPIEIQTYVVTYSIGQVVLQAFFIEPAELERGFRIPVARPGRWDQALNVIWPLPERRFCWPPPQAFDDEHFKQLARRWNKE